MSKWAILAGAVTAAVVLAVGLGFGVSQIAAQEPAVTPEVSPETVLPRGQGGGNCPCGVSRAEAARWGWQAYGQADIIAQTLGVTVGELTAALQDGSQSVAGLAAEKGVALEAVVEALMAPRREALAQAVANGRITQEQADQILSNMQEKVAERLQQKGAFGRGTGPAGQVWRAERMGWQMHAQADIIAETLGMSVEDLRAALQDGSQSVADLAAEKGVALETVVEALLAPRREALSQAVADGKLTQEQVDQMLSNMQENITQRLQQPHLLPGTRMGGRMMDGGQSGRGGMWRGGGMMGGRGRGEPIQP